jgi:hypothetical protein
VDGVRRVRPLELGNAAPVALPVDRQGALAVDDAQLDLLARVTEASDLDPPGRDRPEVAAAADGFRPVRRLELERGRERRLRRDAEQRSVRQNDELRLVAAEVRTLGGRDCVPAAGARNPVDADLAPERPRVERLRPPIDEPAALGELLVERLAAEASYSGSGPGAATFGGVLCAGLR